MSNEKKPTPTRTPTGVSTQYAEYSYKPNEGILKPNPPKKPAPQQTPPKK